MSRYKNIDWTCEYRRSCGRMRSMLEGDMPKVMITNEAQLLLSAAYCGPWRAVIALAKARISSAWGHYAFHHFEWMRTRVFRRMPDPVLGIAERVAEEDLALQKMVDEL